MLAGEAVTLSEFVHAEERVRVLYPQLCLAQSPYLFKLLYS